MTLEVAPRQQGHHRHGGPRSGLRSPPLKRAIQRMVQDPLALSCWKQRFQKGRSSGWCRERARDLWTFTWRRGGRCGDRDADVLTPALRYQCRKRFAGTLTGPAYETLCSDRAASPPGVGMHDHPVVSSGGRWRLWPPGSLWSGSCRPAMSGISTPWRGIFGTADGAHHRYRRAFGCAFKKIGSWIGMGDRCTTLQEVELQMDRHRRDPPARRLHHRSDARVPGRDHPTTRVGVNLVIHGRDVSGRALPGGSDRW